MPMLLEALMSEPFPAESSIHSDTADKEFSIADDRATLRPSDYVEEKFATLTRELPIAVSSLRIRRMVSR